MKHLPHEWFINDHPLHQISWYLEDNKENIDETIFNDTVRLLEATYQQVEEHVKEEISEEFMEEKRKNRLKLDVQVQELGKTVEQQHKKIEMSAHIFDYMKKKYPQAMGKAEQLARKKIAK